MLNELVKKNRTCRRFKQAERIDPMTLRELVDLARHCASGGNQQSLKYRLATDPAENAAIFNCLAWAGAIPDWPGPPEGERPAAYIVILGDTRVSAGVGCDHGIAAQTILLGAVERGHAGCMLGAIQRDALREAIEIPGHFTIPLVIALGTPAEEIRIAPLPDNRYWRDEQGVHHVPKRNLDDIIVTF